MQLTAIITTALLAAGQAAAGINCKGSSQCAGGTQGEYTSSFVTLAKDLDPNRWYYNGQHIMCTQHLCAFLQNTGGMPGSSIKTLISDLEAHGCNKCGSIPVFWPQDNDDKSHGILTINYVSNPKCNWAIC
ncbi:KP4 killer toxin [Fusarium circinatum]|uniref:KP4 killer toxin n=1 Tax=Fusarium circinatum TaxID=48490 RepID=A0A8H5WFG5_FUSCI|nr:KP4 killer toxin [Fusarium circinatum]